MTTEEQARMKELESLIDGAYELVEWYKSATPSQIAWRESWLERAAKLVPQGSSKKKPLERVAKGVVLGDKTSLLYS